MQRHEHKIKFPAQSQQAHADQYRNRPLNFFWHYTSFPSHLHSSWEIHVSKIYDGGERLGVQARATHERTVNFHLRHQPLDIVGLDAATVENPQGAGPLR